MFNLSAPSSTSFILSLLLGGLGIAAKYHYIPVLVPYAFWLVCAGFLMLLIGNLFRKV